MRDRLGIFKNGAGFRLDIGGVCQLLETQLANLCNSTIIEIYDDIIRISHGFDGCQMLEYIAGISTGHQKNGIDDITIFSGL